MPCDGSMIRSDIRGPTLSIVCEQCGRRGRFSVERLIAAHGAECATTIKSSHSGRCRRHQARLADCSKTRSVSTYDRCKAVYERLEERR